MTYTDQYDAPPLDGVAAPTQNPFDVDAYAEAGVLANLFTEPSDLNEVRDLIDADDFVEPRHSVIFSAMCALADEGKTLTLTLVAQHLRAQNLLNSVGGTAQLARLIDPQESAAYDAPAPMFASIVRDNSLRRELVGVARDLTSDAASDSNTLAQEALSNAQSRLVETAGKFARKDTQEDDRTSLAQMMLDLESHARTDEGISTGIPELTEALNGGWKDRSLNVLAARPGVGKSMLACDFAREAAVTQGLRVLFVSLEMTRKELQVRLVSAQSQVPSKLIARNDVDDSDMPAVRTAIEALQDAPLHILDDSSMTMADITREAYAAHQTEGLDLIILDYLQLVRPGKDDRNTPRHEHVGNVANSLRTLAQRLNVPVIALAQLNRDVEKRGGGSKPRLSDLRESGSIEQEAATVLLLHREEEEGATDHTLATYSLSMPKNRFGEGHKGISLLGRLEVAQFVPGAGKFPVAQPTLQETRPAPSWATGDDDSTVGTGPVWGMTPEPEPVAEPDIDDEAPAMFPAVTDAQSDERDDVHVSTETDTVEPVQQDEQEPVTPLVKSNTGQAW